MLYIIATPIGNLNDFSSRGMETLSKVNKIIAEDTRVSRKLLAHFNISKPILSLHDYNEKVRAKEIIGYLLKGESIALISDAGTPLISDPGFNLVRLAHQHNIRVIPIPGPCALIAALSVSGLPTDRFVFEGFLPAKSAVRKKHIEALAKERRTMVFYEAPHRIKSTLQDLAVTFGLTREATLARELTKVFETVKKGTIEELLAFVENDPYQQKGEIVFIVEGVKAKKADLTVEAEQVLKILLAELPLKQAVNLAANITGIRKKVLYNFGIGIGGA